MGTIPFFVGVNVLVVQHGKLLLGKRKNRYGEGEWGLPGGHLEPGESMLVGAARELLEETGLVAAHLEFANLTNGPQDNKHYVHVAFVASGITGVLENREPDACYGWEWFSVDQLPEPIFSSHKPQVLAVLSGVLFTDSN